MMNVIDILLNLLPDLILLSGPFCVFTGMGTGSNTGKLNFRQICSGANISINSNETSIDIISNGVNTPNFIDSPKIVTGSGNGYTGSNSCFVYESSRGYRVKNVSILGNFDNNSRADYNGTGMIIGGYKNYLKVSGCSPLIGCLEGSTIIGGRQNCISAISSESKLNTIINSSNTYIKESYSSTIINGSSASFIQGGQGSSIINSQKSYLDKVAGIGDFPKYSAIINSCLSCIKGSLYSAIMSGFRNEVILECSSVVFNGTCNRIDSNLNNNYVNGNNNAIINGKFNRITGIKTARINSIVNGSCNFIVGYRCSNAFYNNSIINGYRNCISACNHGSEISFNSIINGKCNKIEGGYQKYSTITNGCCNLITGSNSTSNFISGGQCNTIRSSQHSNILISKKSKICHCEYDNNCQFSNGIVNSIDSCIISCVSQYGLCNSTIIASRCSYIEQKDGEALTARGYGNTLAIGTCNKILNSNFSFVAGYCKQSADKWGTSGKSFYQFVFGICNNSAIGYGNSILGGYRNNCICGSNAKFNSIVGGVGITISGHPLSYNVALSGASNSIVSSSRSLIVNGSLNYLGASDNSLILGGCNNKMTSVCNSVLAGSFNMKNPISTCSFCDNTVYVTKLHMLGTASSLSPSFCEGITCTTTTITNMTVCRGIVVALTP